MICVSSICIQDLFQNILAFFLLINKFNQLGCLCLTRTQFCFPLEKLKNQAGFAQALNFLNIVGFLEMTL